MIAPTSRLCFIILLPQSCFITPCPISLLPTHVLAACQAFLCHFLPRHLFPFCDFLSELLLHVTTTQSFPGFIIHSAASALFPVKSELVFSLCISILSKHLIAPNAFSSQLHTWGKPLSFRLSLHCLAACQDGLEKKRYIKLTLCIVGTQTGLCSLAEANGVSWSFNFPQLVVKRKGTSREQFTPNALGLDESLFKKCLFLLSFCYFQPAGT